MKVFKKMLFINNTTSVCFIIINCKPSNVHKNIYDTNMMPVHVNSY